MTKGRDHKDGYDRKYLETLIEEATVDCYDEYEQAAGLLTMIQDELGSTLHDAGPRHGSGRGCHRAG